MRQLLAGLVVLLAVVNCNGGGNPAVGNWTVTIVEDGQEFTLWIIKIDTKDGKVSGEVVPLRRVRASELSDVRIDGDRLRFKLTMSGAMFDMEGKAPLPGARKMFGTVAQGSAVNPLILQMTAAESASDFDKEMVTRYPNDPRVFDSLLELIKEAEENKYTPKQVQEWTQAGLQAARAYGPRWQTELAVNLANELIKQSGYDDVAAEAVQSAVALATGAESRIRVLETLRSIYQRSNQAVKAKAVESQIDTLIVEGHKEHEKHQAFPVKPFAGRKAASDRVVLIELFTGAQCPPCVAADMAFDALAKTYRPAEVALLQYHLHVPGPDPLTAPDSEARQQFYDKFIRGTPSIFFNGHFAELGGGGAEDSAEVYKEYRQLIDEQLDKPAGAQLRVAASRLEDKVSIQAQVSNLKAPGMKTRLRLALVEDWARYRGRNGLVYHHRVVRAFAGGAAGTPLTKQDSMHTAVIDLSKLRGDLGRYLNDFAANQAPFPDSQRPMRLQDLRVVAFVQNDETLEVLQVVDVAVKE